MNPTKEDIQTFLTYKLLNSNIESLISSIEDEKWHIFRDCDWETLCHENLVAISPEVIKAEGLEPTDGEEFVTIVLPIELKEKEKCFELFKAAAYFPMELDPEIYHNDCCRNPKIIQQLLCSAHWGRKDAFYLLQECTTHFDSIPQNENCLDSRYTTLRTKYHDVNKFKYFKYVLDPKFYCDCSVHIVTLPKLSETDGYIFWKKIFHFAVILLLSGKRFSKSILLKIAVDPIPPACEVLYVQIRKEKTHEKQMELQDEEQKEEEQEEKEAEKDNDNENYQQESFRMTEEKEEQKIEDQQKTYIINSVQKKEETNNPQIQKAPLYPLKALRNSKNK